MNKIDRKNIIRNIFKLDILLNDKHTSLTQVCLITIKSLLPNDFGVEINYERFDREIELWNYYKVDSRDENLAAIASNRALEDYFKSDLDNLFYRLLPIIVTNEDFSNIEREIIKNILYSNGNLKDLLEWLMIARLMDLNMKGSNNVMEELKDYIINFQQDLFIEKYARYYRKDIDEYPNNFSVEFEREKIKIISILNGLDIGKDYKLFVSFFNEEDNYLKKILFEDIDVEIHDYYETLSEYVYKLYRGEIRRDKLLIREYKLPDIFSFNEGDVFYHSLLNKCKIIKKEVRNNILTSMVRTITGIYVFTKPDHF